jgi:hypothetical protein
MAPIDTTPDAFSFTAQAGMPLETTIVSNPITVTGINTPASISITACTALPCEYKVNSGSWTAGDGNVINGDIVLFRQTSSANPLTATTATLTIGGVNAAFNVTTASSTDPDATGLISWWKAENNAYDSVGGNHGTAMNGTTYAAGKINQAFSLDGVNDYLLIGDPVPASLQIQNEISLAAWVYITEYAPGMGLIVGSQYDTNHAGASLILNCQDLPIGSIYFDIGDGSWHNTVTSTLLPLNQWVHIVATRKANEDGKVYFNGILQPSTSQAWSGSISYSGAWFAIGQQKDQNRPFKGLIDEAKIFNRALSAVEISQQAGTLPDPFIFTPVTGAPLSASIVSNAVTVAGISNPAAISITGGGKYRINGGECTASIGTVDPGNTVAVCLTSSDAYSTATSATLTIGGVIGTFTVTTAPDLVINPVTTPTPLVSQTISGTVKSGAAVSVSLNSGTALPATVAGSNWSYNVEGFIRGDNGITVTASDTGYSPTKSATINCTAPRLTVSVTGNTGLSGTAGGTVTTSPSGISCLGGSCSSLFNGSALVTLMATPDGNSLFGVWSGDLIGAEKTKDITMGSDSNSGDRSVTASFTYVEPAKVLSTGTLYPHIRDAYAAITGNGTILARQFLFPTGDLTLDKGYAVVIKGGYNPDYIGIGGYSTIQGRLIVGTGSLTVDGVAVR